MLRLTFPYLFFISLAALAGGILNTYHRFGVPAFSPVLLNVVMIVFAAFIAPYYHRPGMALAAGRVRRRARAAGLHVSVSAPYRHDAAPEMGPGASRRQEDHGPDGAGDLRLVGGTDQHTVRHADRLVPGDRQHQLAVLLGPSHGVSPGDLRHRAGDGDPAQPVPTARERLEGGSSPPRWTGRSAS